MHNTTLHANMPTLKVSVPQLLLPRHFTVISGQHVAPYMPCQHTSMLVPRGSGPLQGSQSCLSILHHLSCLTPHPVPVYMGGGGGIINRSRYESYTYCPTVTGWGQYPDHPCAADCVNSTPSQGIFPITDNTRKSRKNNHGFPYFKTSPTCTTSRYVSPQLA